MALRPEKRLKFLQLGLSRRLRPKLGDAVTQRKAVAAAALIIRVSGRTATEPVTGMSWRRIALLMPTLPAIKTTKLTLLMPVLIKMRMTLLLRAAQ